MTTSRRPYSSQLRDEQARNTRRRILDAARELLLANGYTATTIEQIAATAAVSVQTVYNAVGNKAVIAGAVYDATLVGHDHPVVITERPTFREGLAERSARRCLARYAQFGREHAERVAPLLVSYVAESASHRRTLRAVARPHRRRGGRHPVDTHRTRDDQPSRPAARLDLGPLRIVAR